MDAGDTIPANRFNEVHQNGGHREPHCGGNSAVQNSSDVSADETANCAILNEKLVELGLEDSEAQSKASIPESGEGSVNVEACDQDTSKDGKSVISENRKQSAPRTGQDAKKNMRNSNLKTVPATMKKKSKDGRNAEGFGNGKVIQNLHPKQASKSGSFSHRNSDASVHAGKSDSELSEGTLREKSTAKSVKKGLTEDEETEASQDPTAGDSKPRRVGALPNYGFSFKCDERAERRKEFYSKLEEKIHAKEVEKTNLQAKSKETQEAEIKMFRKSLNFKATPMPSFYQEPTPPKTELKKIPPTRAKSPKLGRRKSSPPSEDSKENSARINRPGRLSLDEKAPSQNRASEGTPISAKKPLQKSLPKLPSQKSTLSSEKANDTPSKEERTSEEEHKAAPSTDDIPVEETKKIEH